MPLVRAKLLAAGIHFALSIVVLGAIAVLLLQLWYPWPLWKMLDAPGMLLIAIGVDLVIGPLLTAVVYKPGKPGLKFDLMAIVLLQVAALSVGVHTMAQARPVYVAATAHRFEVVSAHQLQEKELADGDAMWREFSWTGPRYVGVRQPTPLEQMDAVVEALAGNDMHIRPRFYSNFEPVWSVLSVRCEKADDGRCRLIAHHKGTFWTVIADADGRLVDVIGQDLDGALNQPLNAPPPAEPPPSLPFLQTQPAVPGPAPPGDEADTDAGRSEAGPEAD
jgi:hypothetical protein